MKTRIILAAALVLLAGCTIQIGGKTTAGRVIFSAGTPNHHTITHSLAHSVSAGVPSRSLVHGKPHHSRATASRIVRARDLSASNDIVSMSYTLTNTDTNAVVDSKPIDPTNPYFDLFLTPGGNYRIVVDVAITKTAPGTNVGVTRYGDQADFTVDPTYDTYVDLSVHPTNALIFDPASVTSTVSVFDPSNLTTTTGWKMFSSPVTASASDKFFYGPDASLYYFNKNANAVYKWKQIWTTPGDKSAGSQLPMTASDKYIDGTDLGVAAGATGALNIAAACADPWDASTVWLLASDPNNSNQWNYYAVTVDQANPSNDSIWDTVDGGIDTSFLDDGVNDVSIANLSVLVPTAIAVDSTWGDVYVTYYSQSAVTSNVYSGLLQFYGDSLSAYSSAQVDGTSSTQPILTDVAWDQGKAWVLGTPTTKLTGTNLSADSGVAALLTYDDYLSPLSSYQVLQKKYTGTIPTPAPGPSQLILPNRFAGPIQTTALYISQADFYFDYEGVHTSFGHVLSAVNLTTNAVTSY